MLLVSTLAIFATGLRLAAARPADDVITVDPDLRLIKTSEEDPGQWVTEEEKFERFTSKRIGFVDITDIKDEEVLAALSKVESDETVSIHKRVTYPTSAQHVTQANTLISSVSNTNPQSWLTTLVAYNNRHYRSTTGTQASTWLYNTIRTIAAANSAITVRQVTHSFTQPSIIATIPGTSSNLVIVGAHLDSTAGSSSARSPGADDNGSGTVTILEAFRVLVNAGFKPTNTLEFHWYAGEEGGLLGSQDVWSQYKSQAKSVLAFLNQDMTGYSPTGKISIYTDYVDSALTTYVRVLATQYAGGYTTSSCGYGCSDHASARSNGFPAAFVTEDTFANSSPYLHTSSDTIANLQWSNVLRHSKFTVAFLVEASYI